MSDKRTVATDALATLGTIIDETAKRDAIHLAVIPMVASCMMGPGTRCAVEDGTAHPCDSYDDSETVGIVDPFLSGSVSKGERFWLILLPRTIQSLRHVWSHPAFPDEPVMQAPSDVPTNKAASETWLRAFCGTVECPSYETVIEHIDLYGAEDDGYGLCLSGQASGDIPPEFWDHVEIVLGRKMKGRPTYFTCSC